MTAHSQSHSTQTDLDLLQALFEQETTYPWHPTHPESVAYLTELETEFELSDCFTETEINQRSQAFFTQVEELYIATTLQQSLLHRFSDQMPRDLLDRLAEAALKVGQKVSDSSVSLADGLVACVQEILPQWQSEDLYVLARPFAFSMLGPETEVRETPWIEMSEVEQARMSLAIARYALSEIKPTESKSI